jgi:hypothetical protein
VPRGSTWHRPALRLLRQLAAAALVLLAAASALAAGPRWVTGAPYFTTAGQPVVWYTNSPQYFTDPGNLSSTVDHAAADALVVAAAAVWNIPTSSLVLTQGGTLAEHVSGANSYVGSSGVVFPADVQPTNSAAIQIAVIYDHDGSVTDLLLGTGASDPSGCRQSAITESVDSITSDGYIHHAVLVLNGRCTSSDPAMQTQMQYQLMRAFGRILGLGWSQANDNVFTGSPTPTPQQALHWPLMHPIDILCGPYSYQCLPQPFTPRMDDISGMAQLYFIDQGQAAPDKTDSLLNANRIEGRLYFPNGQGMQGVNVVGRRLAGDVPASDVEQWDSVSSVSGFAFRQTNPTPITSQDTSLTASMGTLYNYYEGWYEFGRIDVIWGNWQFLVINTEPVNPLYTGAYSVGPYTANRATLWQQRIRPVGHLRQLRKRWLDRPARPTRRQRHLRRHRRQLGGLPATHRAYRMVAGSTLRLRLDVLVLLQRAGQPHLHHRGHRRGRTRLRILAKGSPGHRRMAGHRSPRHHAYRGSRDRGPEHPLQRPHLSPGHLTARRRPSLRHRRPARRRPPRL